MKRAMGAIFGVLLLSQVALAGARPPIIIKGGGRDFGWAVDNARPPIIIKILKWLGLGQN